MGRVIRGRGDDALRTRNRFALALCRRGRINRGRQALRQYDSHHHNDEQADQQQIKSGTHSREGRSSRSRQAGTCFCLFG